MIEFIAMDLAHQPPAIVQQVGRKRGSRSRRSADPQPQPQPRKHRSPTQWFDTRATALGLGVIVLMDGPNGPYECLIVSRDPDGIWICEEKF